MQAYLKSKESEKMLYQSMIASARKGRTQRKNKLSLLKEQGFFEGLHGG